MLIELEREDDVCILRFKGRFITGADPDYLRVKAEEVKALNCARVLGDLSDVPYIGSTAIAFLVGIYTSVTKNSAGRFVLVGVQSRVREVLDLTRLSTVIPIAGDVPSGLAVLRGA